MRTGEAEYRMPQWLLAREETIEACAARDIGAIFMLARRHTGCYNSKLARLCGLTPSRVGEYISGRSRAQQQQVIERVADGLGIPGHMLGLSSRPWEVPTPLDEPAPVAPRSTPTPLSTPADRLLDSFSTEPAESADDVIELTTEVTLDIAADGAARLMYRHVLLNLGDRPLAKLSRQVWFEHTSGRISVVGIRPPSPSLTTPHAVTLRRVHETESFLKFACLISPPLAPGEPLVVQYLCTGGIFTSSHYWRQDIVRPTRHLQINVRQFGVGELRALDAVEEFGDGHEEHSTLGVLGTHREDGTLFITCSRANLTIPQALTLHWDVTSGQRDRGAQT